MHYMKDTRGCLLLSVTCLVSLLGMALVAITAQGQTVVYVANSHSDSVSVIDTASAVGSVPFGVAMTPEIGPPTNKNQRRKGGWRVFTIPRKFKNQGDCISLVNAGK